MKNLTSPGHAVFFYIMCAIAFWCFCFSAFGQSKLRTNEYRVTLSSSGQFLATPLPVVNLDIPKPDRYRFTGKKIIGLSVIAFASFTDGVVEGYEFDGRKSFERKWNVGPGSYFGSQSWRSVYVDGDPDKGFKSWRHENIGAMDFYHTADDLRKLGYISGGAVYAFGMTGQRKFKHFALDFLIVFGTSSLFKKAGLDWVRG